MHMKPIELSWQGWEFTDVNIFVSDVILAVVCFGCGILLVRLLPERLEHRFWRSFFLSLGLSALLGGIGHLFKNYEFGEQLLVGSWVVNLIAVLLLERAVIEQLRDETLRKWLIVLAYIKLVVMTVLLFIQQDYLIAAISSAIGTIGLLLPVVVFRIRKETEVSVDWFVAGFVLSALGGLAFGLKWDLTRWVQHADLGHYLVAASVVCFYKGVAWLHHEEGLYPAREEVWW